MSLLLIILVVLKNEAYRLKVKNLLLKENYEVVSTSSSEEAIDYLKRHKVCMLLTEVNIGDIDGWRLSRLIRTGILACDESLPIILATENYCERIAESTARMFDINRVISFPELYHLPEVISDITNDHGNLNQTPRILVIEDTEDTAHLVERMLKSKFHITIAYDGISGLSTYKKDKFDIVLLDIMMPGMSGDEVLDAIIEINPDQVVIAMTAHGTIDLAELMLVKGATDYIQKPFKAEQLRKVCDIASKRDDFLIANKQFNDTTAALVSEQFKFDSLSRKHYRILDSLNTVVIELSKEGNITFLNEAWQKTTQYAVLQSVGNQFSDFIHDCTVACKEKLDQAIQNVVKGVKASETLELKIKSRKSGYVWCEFNMSCHLDEQSIITGLSGTIEDISVRKRAEEELKHIALHDTLTGLYNRHKFDTELKLLATDSSQYSVQHSLLYLDLDHFKVINDSQGHHQGDLVLKEVARLLAERTRSTDVLCRIGGDEFAMLLTHTKVENAYIAAQELCSALADSSFTFGTQTYKVSCSIGISSINGLELSPDIYLQQADIAMFAAKEKGRNRTHIYQEGDRVTKQLKDSFEWVQKLQHALSQDNVEMHFQPIINTKTREVVCYEALVRLRVDGELVYPNQFIPSLERAEDMNLLDRHVIGKTLKIMSETPLFPRVAINLSAQVFGDDRLYAYIASKLETYNIDPSHVVFELTESASLSNITGTQRIVNRLTQLGCHFSIDDFGTGFSTFAYLKQIPAVSVKIDGSFVKDMLKQPIDEVLVKAINDTAHALGKTTVAEFVEDEATLDRLAELGVDFAQGYCIGKPMPLSEVTALKSKPTSAA